jgi:hypothetical protein
MSADELEREVRRSPTMNERFLLGLLDEARGKVTRVEALGKYWNGPEHAPGVYDSTHAMEIRAALEDRLDWSDWMRVWNRGVWYEES